MARAKGRDNKRGQHAVPSLKEVVELAALRMRGLRELDGWR